tara:strand:+ start:779 stop:1570 length:792 start_codon:yes stop_codon:yes gene_type:complete
VDLKMQIFVPLTGEGSRFKNNGYSRLKPFIRVHNLPIIYWVSKMFGSKKKINFICQNKHLKKYSYIKSELKMSSNKCDIISIDKFKKKGPVFDLLKCSKYINDDEPILISYCDYYMHWNYKKFVENLSLLDPDGAIPCYTGFHPHLTDKNNIYATCKINKNNFLNLILEKHQFYKNKLMDNHSPGMYYFKSGKIFKKYANILIKSKQSINGEYYVSLIYNFLINDGLKVWCPKNVNFFCQWGTPKDLEEYKYWMQLIKKVYQP